jgi:hypothetical protein
MAVTFNATANGVVNTGTVVNANITVGNNTDRVLYAGVSIGSVTGTSTVTGGGVGTWRLINRFVTDNDRTIEQWGGVAPSTGAQTITATLNATGNAVLGVVSLYGADQTDPPTWVVTTAESTTSTTPVTVTAVNAVGDMSIDTWQTTGGVLSAPSQTQRWNQDQNTNGGGSTSGTAGGSTVHSWTLSPASSWNTMVVSIKQVAVVTPPLTYFQMASA